MILSINKVVTDWLLESQLLIENPQLADKIYFKTDKLSEKDREIILSITGGDNYTYIISSFYHHIKNFRISGINKENIEKLKLLYQEVKNYNKNVFPIADYDPIKSGSDFIYAFETRKKIIDHISKLPSFAKRNMKNDIRKVRTSSELSSYFEELDYFMMHYAFLGNRSEEIQKRILKKMFKSDTTIDDLNKFVDDKEQFIGGVELSKKEIEEMSKTEDFDITYNQGDIMIVEVYSMEGIKAIGCNSLWCFTYGDAYNDWHYHSTNDMVYVLINFGVKSDEADFMHVLIKPIFDEDGDIIEYDDQYPMFDLTNSDQEPLSVLNWLFGDKYEEIAKEYLTFDY